MRKTKEVLRLRFELGFGQRQISRCCGMGLGTGHEYLERATAAGIGWPLPEGMSEEELEAKLFGNQLVRTKAVRQRPQPDWKAIHEQLQQHRHLTLQLVWEEYTHCALKASACVPVSLTPIDVVRFRRDWLSKGINGVWRVMLYRQKNGNPVYVAIPHQAAEAVLAI